MAGDVHHTAGMAARLPLTTQRRNVLTFLGLFVFAAAVMAAGVLFIVRPIANSAEGPATVPAPGILVVADRVIVLDGLSPPTDDTACRINGRTLQCALISRARTIELTAGKKVHCDLKRYPKDERTWGVCHVLDPDPELFQRGENELNRVLVRTGWAIADRHHTSNYVNDGTLARNERAGIWAGIVPERRVATNILAGVPLVKDGATIELIDTEIRLRGVDAPDLGQICYANDLPYDCGRRARAALVELLAGISLVCHIGTFEGDERVWGRCGEDDGTRRDFVANSTSLNEAVVLSGWAVAVPDKEISYAAAESKARAEKRGMWAGEFVRPLSWRDGAR